MQQLALKDRVLRSSSSSSPPASIVGSGGLRPAKYKDWTETKLYKAFEAVQEGMSIRRAAEAYAIPRATLQDRVSGHTQFGSKSGPPKYLDDKEEEELVTFILGCAAMGYAKSKQEIIAIVRKVVAAKGIDGVRVTDGWWTSFKKRHGSLTLTGLKANRATSSPDKVDEGCDDTAVEGGKAGGGGSEGSRATRAATSNNKGKDKSSTGSWATKAATSNNKGKDKSSTGAKRGALSSSVATRRNTNRATSSTDKVDEGCDDTAVEGGKAGGGGSEGSWATKAATSNNKGKGKSSAGAGKLEVVNVKQRSLATKRLCIKRHCGNAGDAEWVCCARCELWLHCSCAGVQYSRAKDPKFNFCCC